MIDIASIVQDVDWYKAEPAEEIEIQKLIANAGIDLPEEYIAFLRFSNGGGGKLGINPGWFQLWKAEEVIQLNKAYQVDKYLPGFFGFGSNGGDELLAFPKSKEKSWKVVMIPFIPMDAKLAILVANNFEEFISAIGKEYD